MPHPVTNRPIDIHVTKIYLQNSWPGVTLHFYSSTLYSFSEVEVVDLPTLEFTDVWIPRAPATSTLYPFSEVKVVDLLTRSLRIIGF